MARPTKYSAAQVTVAKALLDAGYPPCVVQECTHVSATSIHAIRYDRVKQGSATDRIDSDLSRTLTTQLRTVRNAGRKAMAAALRAAADEMEAGCA